MPVVEQEGGGGNRTLWIVLGVGCGGCLLFVALPIVAAILVRLVPVFSRARGQAQRQQCMAHVHALAMSLRMYQADWGDRFPQAATWREGMAKYVTDPAVWRCPSDRLKHASSYGFNPNLSGAGGLSPRDSGRVVVLFGSASSDPNPSDAASWPSRGRHLMSGGARGNMVAYGDGRVEVKVSLEASDLEPSPGRAP